jgi:hypothetical protein
MLKPRFTISNRITAGLTQVERARGFLEAVSLDRDSKHTEVDSTY